MSEPKKNAKKNPENTSVDWAERLKASMNSGYVEPDKATSADEDDDLATLLRAQLGMNTASTSFVESLDTSEFEDEEVEDNLDPAYPNEDELDEIVEDEPEEIVEDEPEEIVEDEPEEIVEDEPEEIVEDEPEEIVEDEPEEIVEDEPEEIVEDELDEIIEDEPEEITEDIHDEYADEYTEAPFDGDVDEYDEDEFVDIPDEEIEDPLDEDYEDSFEDDYEATFEEDDEFDEEELSAPIAAFTAKASSSYSRPVNRGLTDDRLNGLSPEESAGGRRLQELDEENARLLEEITQFSINRESEPEMFDSASEELLHDIPVSQSHTTEDLSAAKAGNKAGSDGYYAAQTHDPLQLDLDDVSPTMKVHSALKRNRNTSPADTGLYTSTGHIYTDAMSPDDHDRDSLRDTELCMRLGYEESLRHADEQPHVEQIRTSSYENQEIRSSAERPAAKHGREYRGRVDTDHVEASYIRAFRKNLTYACVACLGALFAILYDFLPYLLQSSHGFMTLFVESLAYPLTGVLWTFLISIPFFTRLVRGIQSLWNFEPTRYAVAAVAWVVTTIHGILACLVSSDDRLPLFGGVALLMLAVAALSEYWITEGEHKAFSVVSSGKNAHVLTSESTSASSALRKLHGKGAESNDSASAAGTEHPILTVVRTGRIADYFSRTERYNPYMGRLNYMLPVALLIAIVNVGLAIALGGELVADGIPVFTATYLFCLPAAYLLAMTLPLYRVNHTLSQKGAAVIGSAAPAEYAGKHPASLIFSDGDALKSLYRKDITLRGDTDSAEYRRMADAIFRLLDTPLGIEPSLRDRGTDGYRIEIAETDEQYIRLYLIDTQCDRTTEVMMGSHEALTRRGVRLPKINMEQRYKKSENSHVIYLAFNRNFHLAYAAEYRVGRTFARAALALTELGHDVSLASYDPMVSSDMEGIALLRKRNRVELIRPTAYEPVCSTRSSGLIATGRSLDILRPLTACHSMKRAYRTAHLISWILLVVGMSLSVLAVALGHGDIMTPAAAAVWQILSAVVITVATLGSVGKRALSQIAEKPTRPAGASSVSVQSDRDTAKKQK